MPPRFCRLGPHYPPRSCDPRCMASGKVSLPFGDSELSHRITFQYCVVPALLHPVKSNGADDGFRHISKPFDLFADSHLRDYVRQQLVVCLSAYAVDDYHSDLTYTYMMRHRASSFR